APSLQVFTDAFPWVRSCIYSCGWLSYSLCVTTVAASIPTRQAYKGLLTFRIYPPIICPPHFAAGLCAYIFPKEGSTLLASLCSNALVLINQLTSRSGSPSCETSKGVALREARSCWRSNLEPGLIVLQYPG